MPQEIGKVHYPILNGIGHMCFLGGQSMRKIVMSIAAAGLLLTIVPTFAQVGVEVGPGGVGVAIGRDHRDYRRDRVYREGNRFERRRYGCRTIVERHRTPSGRIIEKRKRVC